MPDPGIRLSSMNRAQQFRRLPKLAPAVIQACAKSAPAASLLHCSEDVRGPKCCLTKPWPEKAIASFSTRLHGMSLYSSDLCASAKRMIQQGGLVRRPSSAPAKSNSFLICWAIILRMLCLHTCTLPGLLCAERIELHCKAWEVAPRPR